jgi:hypothetical protein
MRIDTKLIFGLRTTEPVTLTLSGQPGPLPPDLLIKTSGQVKDTVIPYASGAWTAELAAGDHVVWLQAPGDCWFDGPVSFTLSSASTIVVHAASSSPMAWRTTAGVNDPKNPWPPPLAAEPLSDQTWLGQTVQELSAQVSVERTPLASVSLPRKTAP